MNHTHPAGCIQGDSFVILVTVLIYMYRRVAS